MSMAKAIEPKSNQMNSMDLLAGEKTLTITAVKVHDTPEQPVSIWFAEFPEKRPFKPSKTVSRILVKAWGEDENAYIGRRLTLYRDPDVTWAGEKVGGIRIKAMSHIERAFSVALAASQNKVAPWRIEKLADSTPSSPPTSEVDLLREEWKTATDERKAEIQAEVERLQGGGSDV